MNCLNGCLAAKTKHSEKRSLALSSPSKTYTAYRAYIYTVISRFPRPINSEGVVCSHVSAMSLSVNQILLKVLLITDQ